MKESKKISKVPEENQEQGIQWLVLEDDSMDSGGVFLFFHENIDEASVFDQWFETSEKAEAEAKKRWGVSESHWTTVE